MLVFKRPCSPHTKADTIRLTSHWQTISNKSTEDLQLNELNKNGEMRVTGSELALFESPATRVCVEAGGLQP